MEGVPSALPSLAARVQPPMPPIQSLSRAVLQQARHGGAMDQRRQAGNPLDAVVVPSFSGERSATAIERPGLQLGQPLAQTGPAAADHALVAHESPAAAGENRGPAGEACAVLLAPAGGRASDPAAVRRHAAEDLSAAGAGRLTRGLSATKPAWQSNGTSVERCLRNAPKAAAPVGRTSARTEVTGSGAGRLCDEQNFVRSAAIGCIKVPSGAGKTEIPGTARRSE